MGLRQVLYKRVYLTWTTLGARQYYLLIFATKIFKWFYFMQNPGFAVSVTHFF
jgi:hypothetical protein